MRTANAKWTAGTLALFCLAGLGAATAVSYFNAPARPRELAVHSAATKAATALPVVEPARAARVASIAAAPALPVSLAGSMPPRLPLDERGRLRKARGVRDFFDYFLTARSEMPEHTLDALVRKEVSAQLDGTPAQLEAFDVWQRYLAYLVALDNLTRLAVPDSDSGTLSAGDLDAMQSSIDQRAGLASRTLGADWSEAFFGHDSLRAHYRIERWRIQRDSMLTDAQKTARLQAHEASLPPAERAMLERSQQAQARVTAVARLQQQALTLDQLREKAIQEFGPQAADRIVKIRQDADAWRAKYADYAAQRASIDTMGLSPADRDAQIKWLREQVFTPTEALRAAALDRGARP
jgi:lipase chaperone LimK